MKHFTVQYDTSAAVDESAIAAAQHELEKIIASVAHERSRGYETPYASLHLPADAALRTRVKALVEKKKQFKPHVLIVVGIGGSNLGTWAVHQALYGILANELDSGMRVYYADTVDPDAMADIVTLMKKALNAGQRVLLNVISKSGTTTETIANYMVLLQVLQDYHAHDYRDYVVITTDEGSALWRYAQSHQFDALAIPKLVGGRYSVLSAVGLFPLALLGVDIDQLHAGAAAAVEHGLVTDIAHNVAARSAAILAHAYRQQYVVHNMFLFGVSLESLGKWYRQLLAESIGKEYDTAGNQANVGILPTVSIGSTDLHSVAQLYLSGPYNIITTFVSLEKHKHNLIVPAGQDIDQLVAHIAHKPLATLLDAILHGVYAAYKHTERPFIRITLPECSAWFLGQFMQYAMLQTMYVGALLHVNPFDQPNVELYKAETRKMLARE